jgi:hypothetical protein
LVLGAVADAVFADPARWHPVAGFGACAAALERRCYADSRTAGAAHTAVMVAGVVGLGVAVEAATWRRPVAHAGATLVATWAVLGGTSLATHGRALAAALDMPLPPDADARSAPNLDAARALIPTLCGRDPQSLDVAGMARAGTESMAENSSDAAVAPLLWGAVAGMPGLLGYRAINTLDAMVGPDRLARDRRDDDLKRLERHEDDRGEDAPLFQGLLEKLLVDVQPHEEAVGRRVGVDEPGAITLALFAPDNKSLITASGDGLIKFWNLQTRSVALTLRHSRGPGAWLALSPDGNLLVSCGADGTVRLWPADSFAEIDAQIRVPSR